MKSHLYIIISRWKRWWGLKVIPLHPCNGAHELWMEKVILLLGWFSKLLSRSTVVESKNLTAWRCSCWINAYVEWIIMKITVWLASSSGAAHSSTENVSDIGERAVFKIQDWVAISYGIIIMTSYDYSLTAENFTKIKCIYEIYIKMLPFNFTVW